MQEDIENYGYYVSIGNKYYLAKPSQLRYHFDLSKLGDISATPDNTSGEAYQVIVHQQEWSLHHTNFYVYDIDFGIRNFRDNTTPLVKKLADDKYQLTFEGLKDGQVLFALDTTGLYALGLGHPEKHAVELFLNTQESASLVVDRIKLALKSFPENEQLKTLLEKWQKDQILEKDLSVWKEVEEKLAKYQSEDDLERKEIFARETLHSINYYLSLSEEPKFKSQATELINEIEKNQSDLLSQVKNTKIEIPDISDLKDEVQYFTDGTIKIAIVDIGSEGDVLIRFSGLANEHNNLVYRHKKAIQNPSSGAFIYQTREINGKNWNSFIVENDGWSGDTISSYPPGIEERAYIGSDYSDSEDNALKLYRDYSERVKKYNQEVG